MYDILKDYERPMAGEGPFFTMYYYQYKEFNPDKGLDGCTWGTDYTYLNQNKDKLVSLFNEYYQFRELGQETEYRFQLFLQRRLDEISEDFDHRFKIYSTVDIDELGTGYNETESHTRELTTTDSASATESNNSKFKDTPTSVAGINNPTTETDESNESSGESNGTENETITITHDKTQHDDEMITEANRLLSNYRTISMEFVKAFEPCFMQLFR